MNLLMESVMVLLVLIDLAFLGTSRLPTGIRFIAIQGALLGILPLLTHGPSSPLLIVILALVAFVVKGIVFPWMLLRAIHIVKIRREVEPFIGYSLSLMIGILLIAISAYLSAQWQPMGVSSEKRLVLFAAFTMVLTGLLVVISRRKAISQVLGYLILENGVYSFGMVMLRETAFLVELALLLDAFVAILVMSIAIHQIHHEFAHIDVDQLRTLRG